PALAGKKFPLEVEYPEQPQIQCPEWDEWKTVLTSEKVSSIIAENGRKPLILDSDGRLYLQRYWQYEKNLAENLKKRATAESPSPEKSNWLQKRLNQLFPHSDTDDTQPNWQKIAAFAALRSKLTIISGGPGTGKTTTVARILTLLLEDHAFSDRESRYRILVAAPTGKAAARLSESLRQAKNATMLNENQNPNFNYLATSDAIRDDIPEEAQTIHRLLRPIFGTPRFQYNRQNPLPADVLVVDEASMVALPLMAKLVAALPESARLILIGDMDQLASVEPGYVLGDICEAANIDSFPADFCTEYGQITGEKLPEIRGHHSPLAGTAIHLKHSHRFKSGSAIAKIS
ncbi:AAA family ATPase, partial [bacterium]|nr:AAA family ATPase [bacterium]